MKDVYVPPLSCFNYNHYGFWKLTFLHNAKFMYKIRRGVYNIEMYFKQFLPTYRESLQL